MSRLIQNRIKNTFSRLKPSIALSSSTLIKNLSTSPEPSPEPLDESSEIWNVTIGRAGGDRVVSEDEVFHRLSNDPFCNRVNLSDTLLQKLLHRFRDDWRSALGVLKWAESRKAHHHKHSPEAYDLAVDILGKAKKWDRMKDLIIAAQDQDPWSLAKDVLPREDEHIYEVHRSDHHVTSEHRSEHRSLVYSCVTGAYSLVIFSILSFG
ncbi:hypothetical protein F2Q70_00044289 [Brassica cretica]|uniref:Uncharacterized protein n=1 Tax=Brassica cretica TaxID=69181 RepID=A0A8S9KF06_BRACR|nr:hypothetical protein F2Q70_00044289 [Brassica cretica]